MVNDELGDQLEERVNIIKAEASQGRLTTNTAKQATTEAVHILNQTFTQREHGGAHDPDIIPVSSMDRVLTPLFADYFGGRHGDKYAQGSMELVNQFKSKQYWETLADNPKMIHYMVDDVDIGRTDPTQARSTEGRRGIDALFVSGLLRNYMVENTDVFQVIGKPYFRDAAQRGLPKVANACREDNDVPSETARQYDLMARNFEEVSDTLALAGRHLFSDPT
jgi:hypothetical protein